MAGILCKIYLDINIIYIPKKSDGKFNGSKK